MEMTIAYFFNYTLFRTILSFETIRKSYYAYPRSHTNGALLFIVRLFNYSFRGERILTLIIK